jgi:hypothetical protein
MSEQPTDFRQLDDSALISLRARMRSELEQLPPLSDEHFALVLAYDASTAEIDERARRAWQRTE